LTGQIPQYTNALFDQAIGQECPLSGDFGSRSGKDFSGWGVDMSEEQAAAELREQVQDKSRLLTPAFILHADYFGSSNAMRISGFSSNAG